MNQTETHALYARAEAARAEATAAGKDDEAAHAAATAVWNAWAEEMLAERKRLEEAGTWEVEKDPLGIPGPRNHTTYAWFRRAAAEFSIRDNPHTFSQPVVCRGWNFPGYVVFLGAIFSGTARFDTAIFGSAARFDGATFKGTVGFDGATFSGHAAFDGATFTDDVEFNGATFTGDARFWKAAVAGKARFRGAKFTGTAGFAGATFTGTAWFDGATFSGAATFGKAAFTGTARFDRVVFTGAAEFDQAIFTAGAGFDNSSFIGIALFDKAVFTGDTKFAHTEFVSRVQFGGAAFAGAARFDGATFTGDAWFNLTKFNGNTAFARAQFRQGASFNAIKGESAFTLEGARFREVPDFIQADFKQAPRLDNVIVAPASSLTPPAEATRWQRASTWPSRFSRGLTKRIFQGDSATSARYRSLKRLAIQGHDLEREQMFHAGEIRSARFASDWPIHWKLWSTAAWTSMLRFWFGLIYEVLSDFGRSVMRPLVAWLILLVVSASVYLGANPDMTRERDKLVAGGASLTVAYAETTLAAWQRNQPCVANGAGVQGLPDAVRNVTSAVTEALHLSFANGAVLGDVGSPDTGTRTYGCLYGLAPVSAEARLSIVPYPSIVSTMSKIQKAFSALLIFLFGLAVRNMLKMK